MRRDLNLNPVDSLVLVKAMRELMAASASSPSLLTPDESAAADRLLIRTEVLARQLNDRL